MNKLKNLSYPALLMLAVIITEISSALVSLTTFVNPPFMFIIRYIIGSVFDPLVFFLMLAVFREKVNKKTFAIVSLVLCALSFKDLIGTAPLLTGGAFLDIIIGGQANTVLFALFKTAMLAVLGISLISDKKMTGLYNALFGLGAFSVLYGSVLMAVANPAAIITNLSDFLFLLSLWYIPRLFDENKVATTAVTGKKIKFVVILVAAMYILLFVAGGLANSSSGSSSSSSSSSSGKNGFIGSDGKYHAYVPEFGDDVNNWMEENW